jgi:hypothetical protein
LKIDGTIVWLNIIQVSSARRWHDAQSPQSTATAPDGLTDGDVFFDTAAGGLAFKYNGLSIVKGEWLHRKQRHGR